MAIMHSKFHANTSKCCKDTARIFCMAPNLLISYMQMGWYYKRLWATCSPKLWTESCWEMQNWVWWKLNHQEHWTKKRKILFVKFCLLLVIYINAFWRYFNTLHLRNTFYKFMHSLGIEPVILTLLAPGTTVWTTEFLGQHTEKVTILGKRGAFQIGRNDHFPIILVIFGLTWSLYNFETVIVG